MMTSPYGSTLPAMPSELASDNYVSIANTEKHPEKSQLPPNDLRSLMKRLSPEMRNDSFVKSHQYLSERQRWLIDRRCLDEFPVDPPKAQQQPKPSLRKLLAVGMLTVNQRARKKG